MAAIAIVKSLLSAPWKHPGSIPEASAKCPRSIREASLRQARGTIRRSRPSWTKAKPSSLPPDGTPGRVVREEQRRMRVERRLRRECKASDGGDGISIGGTCDRQGGPGGFCWSVSDDHPVTMGISATLAPDSSATDSAWWSISPTASR